MYDIMNKNTVFDMTDDSYLMSMLNLAVTMSGDSPENKLTIYVLTEANFREVIKQLREERGLSLRALSRKSGVPLSTLSQIENGRSVPGVDSVAKILDALGVKIELRTN